MHFLFYCVDKPDHAHVRAANREAHLAYVGGFKDRLLLAGPTLSEDGGGMTGSLLVLDFPDRAAAEAFAADDPYNKAGLFETVEIKPWRKTLPAD